MTLKHYLQKGVTIGIKSKKKKKKVSPRVDILSGRPMLHDLSINSLVSFLLQIKALNVISFESKHLGRGYCRSIENTISKVKSENCRFGLIESVHEQLYNCNITHTNPYSA